jgi:hypothetical protein
VCVVISRVDNAKREERIAVSSQSSLMRDSAHLTGSQSSSSNQNSLRNHAYPMHDRFARPGFGRILPGLQKLT